MQNQYTRQAERAIKICSQDGEKTKSIHISEQSISF